MFKNCIVCGSQQAEIVFTEYGINVLRCICGHFYSDSGISQNNDQYYGDDDLIAETYHWWDEAHRRMYDDFVARFVSGKSGRLLDVGCGLGYLVKRIGREEDWHAQGCEISPVAVKFTQDKLDLNSIRIGKVEDLHYEHNYFDIITLFDVIEHISDPNMMLECLFGILKPGGFVFMHTPNGPWQLYKGKLKKLIHRGIKPDGHYMEARDHVNLYTEKSIRRVLENKGFREISFVHLPPIQSVSGNNSKTLINLKNLWWYSAAALSKISFGRINIDNLSVIAKK